MLARKAAPRRKRLQGVTAPRIAPPEPIRSLERDFKSAAAELGIDLMPWQVLAARYMTGLGWRGRGRPKNGEVDGWKYREVCIVVARQNGKTTLLLPRILMALKRGESVLHTAQNRAIPRETFEQLADHLRDLPDYRIVDANGRETIRCRSTGGRYILVAPRHGVRGYHADLVIQDEIREQTDDDLARAMLPTTMASRNPQTLYITNAGDDRSVVLNRLRDRRDEDDLLAYLEWSADPERDITDRDGWAQANPALGHIMAIENLEAAYQTQSAAGFETEHLCRWVIAMAPRLLAPGVWEEARGNVGNPLRPVLGISMDASGTRASAVLAWRQSDGIIGVRVAADVTGQPIDLELLGPELRDLAIKLGVVDVVYDPWTDKDFARYFGKATQINGLPYANACEKFVRLVEGKQLRWDEAPAIETDLPHVGRKYLGRGAWMAVHLDDHPITSVLAAIRATWEASEGRQLAPRVY